MSTLGCSISVSYSSARSTLGCTLIKVSKLLFSVSVTDRLHRGCRLHEVLERAKRVALPRKEWQIHRGRGKLQPSSWWLRRRCIDSFTKVFHIGSLTYFRVLRLHVLAGVRIGYVRDCVQGRPSRPCSRRSVSSLHPEAGRQS